MLKLRDVLSRASGETLMLDALGLSALCFGILICLFLPGAG
jgi:hypothetical protein